MPSYPDEPLPTLTLSIKEFNEIAYQLLDYSHSNRVDPMHHKFVNFVLSGRYTVLPHGQEHRVHIDVTKDVTPTQDIQSLKLCRDYDSIIGLTENLPFRVTMAMHPIPPFSMSLKKSNHLMKTIITAVSKCLL